MEIETGPLSVKDNEAAQQFEIHYDGKVAALTYRRTPNEIAYLHTGVPAELEGHGLAARLARHSKVAARFRSLPSRLRSSA